MANYASQPSAEEMLAIWKAFKADQSDEQLRNRLIEIYLPLVKYNGERICPVCPMASNSTISCRRARLA